MGKILGKLGLNPFGRRASGRFCLEYTLCQLPPDSGELPVALRIPMSQSCQRPQKMLLCIDDSPEIVDYERSILEQSGYLVLTATSARRGLALATMCSFDAVVLDYQMPEMNGHQLAHEIRRLRPETPVVMFSGGEVPEETRQLVDAVVHKTEAHRELLPTVARLCNPSMPS